MRWQQYVRVVTGMSCWQILLHLVVIALLVAGWMHGALVRVGLVLCVCYAVTLVAMLTLQRHPVGRRRELGDALEELTTTWYFGAAMIALWLISRVVHNPFLLGLCGLGLLAGPALLSLLTRENRRRSGNLASKHGVRR
ncbi:hypothetical protein F9C28_17165 [Shimwellia pseudoproteus]|uniref:YbhQ family protein n=1 Tax=Shimwellia pseudoproteus TaxID=570012 RepID=UPI0018EA4305|nr:YbhQ family protein [Shimwellia pseudoproteus]MBJ3816598.1 hypothetical protein [Shimwellia pseudoproteus]